MAASSEWTAVDLAGLRAHVDGGGVAVGAEVGHGGGVADEHGGVDVGGEDGGAQDSGDVEPLAAEPDAFSGEDPVDAEALGGQGAEHRDRLSGGGGVRKLPAATVSPVACSRPRLAPAR